MLESIIAALASLSIAAILWTFVVFAVFIVLTENEWLEMFFLAFVGTVMAFAIYNGIPQTLQSIWSNLGSITIYFIAYLIIGVFWSFFKFDRFCAEQAKYIETGIIHNRNAIENKVEGYLSKSRRFANWIIGWPFSMIAYAGRDLFLELAEYITSMFGNTYRRIAMRHFKPILDKKENNLGDKVS